jgi:hypothetical protein
MKTTTTLTIDADLMAQIRLKRLNLSNLVNSYLQVFLNSKELKDTKIKDVERKIIEQEAKALKLKDKLIALKELEKKKPKPFC